MAASKSKNKNTRLGQNPLTQSIYTKTEIESEVQAEQEPESKFLCSLKPDEKEGVNLQLAIKENEWLDDLVRLNKRLHKKRIPKEIWLRVGVQLLMMIPSLEEANSVETLREVLADMESILKTQDSRIKNVISKSNENYNKSKL